jgi:hypothetical protein
MVGILSLPRIACLAYERHVDSISDDSFPQTVPFSALNTANHIKFEWLFLCIGRCNLRAI